MPVLLRSLGEFSLSGSCLPIASWLSLPLELRLQILKEQD